MKKLWSEIVDYINGRIRTIKWGPYVVVTVKKCIDFNNPWDSFEGDNMLYGEYHRTYVEAMDDFMKQYDYVQKHGGACCLVRNYCIKPGSSVLTLGGGEWEPDEEEEAAAE